MKRHARPIRITMTLLLVVLLTLTVMPAATLARGVVSPGVPANNDAFTHRYIDVQLLGINDYHGQLTKTTTIGGKPVGGADYLAAWLRQKQAENKNTLMVHAGDVVGASMAVSAILQDEPTIELLDLIGFDVGTPGNHEFDEGVPEMMRLIEGGYHEMTGEFDGASFPYISANVVDKASGELILPPYVVKKVNGMPIGFIGVTWTGTPSIVMASAVESVEFLDEVTAINQAVADLKAQKVETIIVLAHVDGAYSSSAGTVTGTLGYIANHVDDEVDVIISGHNHAAINHVVDGKLIVQSSYSGYAFSDIDLVIDPLTKDVVAKSAQIQYVYRNEITPDPEVTQLVAYYSELVAPLINQVIATAATNITRTQNAAGESALGNLIADGQRWKMGTDFAFMNPGGIRTDILAGEVTWGELFNVQPFSNDLTRLTLTGTQIRALLEQQFDVNKMLQISGLTYTWANNDVIDIFLPGGAPIDPAASYSVAANIFLATGGDGFTVFNSGTGMVVGANDLAALIEYVKQLPQPFSAAIDGRITRIS